MARSGHTGSGTDIEVHYLGYRAQSSAKADCDFSTLSLKFGRPEIEVRFTKEKGFTNMSKNNHEAGVVSRDAEIARVESIEDLLRRNGFFDSADREKKRDEAVLVH